MVVTAFEHQHVDPFGDELPGDEPGGEPAADDDHSALLESGCHGLLLRQLKSAIDFGSFAAG